MRLANVSNLNFCPFFFSIAFILNKRELVIHIICFFLFGSISKKFSAFCLVFPFYFIQPFASFRIWLFFFHHELIHWNEHKEMRKKKCAKEKAHQWWLFLFILLTNLLVQREYFCRRPLKIISGMPFRLSAFFYNNFFFFSFYVVIWMRISAFGLKDLYMLRKNANLFDTNNRKSLKSCNEKCTENEDYNILKLFFFWH